jgi:hypothetical protein
MSDIISIRQDAVSIAKLALENDKAGNIEEAINYYLKAAEMLKILNTIDEDLHNKETYRKKVIEYSERAEFLKNTALQ